ncbi:hypothetical protein PR003_g20689 [Phytophthora rubi]|uniref:DDE-1 domain-containing protein n=1 Tax=Phytophthora rubi TaxID=129364 RepID=A0A6A4DJS7_9STRA|nr:hypothetical protein PR002_g3328 [Phytophthora rubi]KAE9051459.1 hypothetical protein PR001_g1422 [Phytophthora rubi]KAE9308675.1 hypothetical protein PR003_g20689 [Phytophthora rubi]
MRAHGELGAVDLEAAAPDHERLRGIIATYSHSYIYNMDETGFFYANVPRGSMCIREAPPLKQSKSRITLVVCTNATGTHKLPLIFIGKSRQPRWIKNKPADIDYKSTTKAWMDTESFQSWLLGLDKMMQG